MGASILVVCCTTRRHKFHYVPVTPSRKRREANREKWKKDAGYGKRRTAEIVFSAFRRMSGDYSKKWDNMVREVRIRAAAYDRWVGEAPAAA